MADFDGDGQRDLITGCFEGGSYLLAGSEGGRFAAPKAVLDKAGRVLRAGQYWDDGARKWTGVEGSRFKDLLGISATPVDWDADGDLDLLLGTNSGRVLVRANEGSAREPAFAAESVSVEAHGQDLEVRRGHAMPVAADWDGDGLWDLITGSGGGAVYWYRNLGKAGEPAFAAAAELVPNASGGLERPGERTQVSVGDFDGDGRADLVVGDFHSRVGGGEREYHGWVWLFRRKPAPAEPRAPGQR